ncbi:protein mini spindles isoform X2 [Agrilus planipennis]|uniref:Protein mini spindles isoform X2 n=1 Tax=Agrilus planipennis TaxID=224129 RepID=A0A1W4X2D8_AGRPL|nr:protein mini spindles isoform X2 [Agrilus planipennis]
MEDDEWKKLPIEDRCVHKSWKARINGYEEVTKLFKQIDDEKSPEFAKYLGLIKKFVTDSNAASQEKGLEATLAYVENYAHAGKTVGEVMSGVVTKCMAAQKIKTKELALQVTLMFVEIEKQEAVVEELIKGTEQKNPKIVAACVNALTVSLREFGSKVINVKPAIKKIPTLFADRDKNVRDEAKGMVVEIYRWIGPALKSQLTGLQAVQITELEAEFTKIEGQKVSPTRYLRSQQEKQSKLAAEAVEDDDEEPQDETNAAVPIDAYDLADPVDILSKLPKNFYEQLESKKWQERKEMLELLENLLKTPKLENGDYGDLVRSLKKIVQKDSNVVVVTVGTKCLGGLANGLKKRFQTYAGVCLPALLEKFKEKKQTVVVAIREAVDAIYLSTTIEAIFEDVIEILNNKNPAVKSETALFLARAFAKTQPTALNKKLLKAYSSGLIKNINEPDPTVRDSSAEALGILMKLVGEKALGPFLTELEKDNLKMMKIKEFSDKAVILVKTPAVKKGRAATAPPKISGSNESNKTVPKKSVQTTQKSSSSVPSSGTATIVKTKKRVASAVCSGTTTIIKSKGKATPERARENEISEEEAVEISTDLLTDEIMNGLIDTNWKIRLGAIENMANKIQMMESAEVPTQAFVKVIKRKPGLKDTNFQVLKARLDIIKYLAENCKFSTTTGNACISEIADKLGDSKNGTTAAETLTAIAEATKLEFVAENVMDFAFSQKSPKVMQESLAWLSGAIKEFGLGNMNVKNLIENSKKALGSTNPAVRLSAINFLGTLYLYLGPMLHMFFENEKPALLEQINAEFSKYENEKPPAPTRGLKKSPTTESLGGDTEEIETEGACADGEINIQDLLPRVDISSQITEALITEMSDKNWKVRNEALVKVNTIIQEAKLIKPNIGDLPQALALRLVDSNTKIAQAALGICESIANSMGQPCKQYIRVFLPGFLQGLGDSKAWIRSGCINCMNTYGELCAYKEFFEAEMIADALKIGSPTLRTELWNWLAEKLPKMKSLPKEELHACIPHLYSNLEDRNADVRKNAHEAVFGFMIHLGYDSMLRQSDKLKPGSKTTIVAALDKARPNLPIKPLPKAKASEEKENKVVRGTKSATIVKPGTKAKGPVVVPKSAPVRKKEEEVDTSPLLTVNNMKHQRTIDESKLKVLKWNFTTPREEFVELLKEQMTNANINRNLIANMFHSDFRYHLKAIDSLMEALPDNIQALISNLDLILKWVTLRFFDTNPSVLLKALEYLHSVFNALIENKYHLLESEASSFIPYLCLKTGDPKDAVRNGVRSLFNQICNIFPVSKLFSYVMEGLKSKNARQRTECLDIMGSLIENYGIGVCVPSPSVCLKEVAKQISDRDNSVRNAALNCVVQAYYIVGEKVFKMVGQISDKDMSLLEERIKRAKKPVPKMIAKVEPMTAASLNPIRSNSHDRQNTNVNSSRNIEVLPSNNSTNGQMDTEDDVIDEDEFPRVTPLLPQPPQQEITEYSGPYQLDPELLKRLDSIKYDMPKLQLYQFDLDFLKDEVVVPSIDDARVKVMPLSAPNPILPNQSPLSGSASSLRQGGSRDYLLEKLIKQMSSTDRASAFEAMDHLQTLLISNKGQLMAEYEDSFMSGIAAQLRIIAPEDPRSNESVTRMYRLILTALDAFYQNKNVGTKVSVPLLKEVLTRLILLLVDAKLEGCHDGDAFVRVVNVHCVKIIERSDHSNTICALIQLLHECIRSEGSPRQTELVMKCLWRVIKIMPTWAEELDYDSILLEIHNFLKDYPSAWWKTKPSDTPLRTIKTIVHSMTKAKGGQLMLHLGKVPNTSESELESYILRLLKSLKLEEVKQIPVKTDTLSRSAQKTLKEIFEKMAKKSDAKDALNLLYDFLQQHPEISIEPYLKESKILQDYVNNGLKEIGQARKALKETEKFAEVTADTETSASKGLDSKGVEYYKERLQMWNEVWNQVTKGSPQK